MVQKLSPTEAVAALIALSVVEHTNSDGVAIVVELGDKRATITDTGRGMKVAPDAGEAISHAEKGLTSVFPVVPDDPDIERLLNELVWGDQGSLGPAAANAACVEFRFTSRRCGEEWTQVYRSGTSMGPPQRVGPTDATGTTVDLTTTGPINYEAIHTLAEQLRTALEGLRLTVVAEA